MLTSEEQQERRRLIHSGHTAQTSSRVDTLNRKLNGSKSDAQVLSEMSERAKAGEAIGQLAAEARRRGLSFLAACPARATSGAPPSLKVGAG